MVGICEPAAGWQPVAHGREHWHQREQMILNNQEDKLKSVCQFIRASGNTLLQELKLPSGAQQHTFAFPLTIH